MEKELPLVSIIAIAYNHEQYLVQTLDSILHQDYPNIELILIESASQDQSASLIKEWVKDKNLPIQTIFQKQPRSITQNANEGLSLVSGKYFQILSCDDILEAQKISKQVEVFQNSDNQLAVVYCDAVKIDEKGELMHTPSFFEERSWQHESQLPSGSIFTLLLQDYFLVAPTVLVNTQIVKDFGGYDEQSMMEDLDIFLRLSQKFGFKGIPYKGVQYRILQTSLLRSTSATKRQINRLMLYSRFLGQKGEWDRYISYQFLLLKKDSSLFYRFLYSIHRLIQKLLLNGIKSI